jgi:hypothetical protein
MNEDGEKLQRLDLEDVTGFVQDLVGAMTVYVDKHVHHAQGAAALAGRLPSARGVRHAHARESRRAPLAYLWMLDALMQSPDALIEAMIEARSQLLAADEALKPFTGQ